MSYQVTSEQLRDLLLLNSQALSAIKAGIRFDNIPKCLKIAVERQQSIHKTILDIAGIKTDPPGGVKQLNATRRLKSVCPHL